MPIFLSYSHADDVIANRLADDLRRHNTHVWVDTWELSVGDSIINKVQDAIKKSSALLVLLSKASVRSEWCKKELSAGLMRELEEKRVVVLPVLVEDCEIPVFLREKMYADLREDYDRGLNSILDAIAKVTNLYQGRLEEEGRRTDWAEDWGFRDGLFHLRFTIIDSSDGLPMTFLTQVYVMCNEVATARYRQYESANLGWIGRAIIAETLFDFGENNKLEIPLDSQFQRELKAKIGDPNRGAEYELLIESRRMGQDAGKDILINISNYLIGIREFVRSVSRDLTREESLRMFEIVSRPWSA